MWGACVFGAQPSGGIEHFCPSTVKKCLTNLKNYDTILLPKGKEMKTMSKFEVTVSDEATYLVEAQDQATAILIAVLRRAT